MYEEVISGIDSDRYNKYYDEKGMDLINGSKKLGTWQTEEFYKNKRPVYYYYTFKTFYIVETTVTGSIIKPSKAAFKTFLKQQFWWWNNNFEFEKINLDKIEYGEYFAWVAEDIKNKVISGEINSDHLKDWWDATINDVNEDFFIQQWEKYFGTLPQSDDDSNENNNSTDSSFEENGTSENPPPEEEENIPQKYYYILLQLELIQYNNTAKYELGYYLPGEKNTKIWKTVYQFEEQEVSTLKAETINKVLIQLASQSSINNKNYYKVFMDKNFSDSYNNLSGISSLNLISRLNAPIDPGFEKVVYYDKGTNTLKEFSFNNYYEFKNFSVDVDAGITAADRKKATIGLMELWRKDLKTFLTDLNKIADFIYGVDGVKAEQMEPNSFSAIQIEYVEKYFYTIGDRTQSINTILSDLADYYYSYRVDIIDNGTVLDINKLRIITYEPEGRENQIDYSNNSQYKLIGRPCYEWREELYRKALLAKEKNTVETYYDEELLAFWRDIFDTTRDKEDDWKGIWDKTIKEKAEQKEWTGWNPAVYTNPGEIKFWLEFLDNDKLLNQFSVSSIGRRTNAVQKENIKKLYNSAVPDIIFLENKNNNLKELEQKIQSYNISNQKYCVLKSNDRKYFTSSGTGLTAFDLIREMIYTHIVYNSTVGINCTPKYYLEPNNIIRIDDSKSNIHGDYIISQFTLPLTYNGNMSITTNEALVRM